jgi:hypothetical protein
MPLDGCAASGIQVRSRSSLAWVILLTAGLTDLVRYYLFLHSAVILLVCVTGIRAYIQSVQH